MAAKLGYGGLGNTNGARSFAGKEEAEEVASQAYQSTFAVAFQIGFSIALTLFF